MKLAVATILLTASLKAKRANAQASVAGLGNVEQISNGYPENYGDCDFGNDVADVSSAAITTVALCEARCEDPNVTFPNNNLWGYSYGAGVPGASGTTANKCVCWGETSFCELRTTTVVGTDALLKTFCYGCREPSSKPSSMPSEAPSSQPSSRPSEQPSSIPSETPSSQPSSIPSEAPSSIPSESPSMQPSEHPSESPSCTPSIEPTAGTDINSFYADWTPSGNGCKNDGNEPNYMASNPSNYLYSTLDKCCSAHFSWNYLSCMGQLDGVCARSLWYPDWTGSDKGCLNDGNEPSYMAAAPKIYLYGNKAECCEEHYSWDYNECVGRAKGVNNGLYYPDFDSSDHVCRKDGLQPMYMDQAPEWWMHKDLKECCTTNYSWNYEACVKSDPNAVSVANPDTDGKYFPDWLGSEHMCKNDNTQPSYMTKNPSMWMYDTLDKCCKARYSWKYDECRGSTASATGTSTSTSSSTGKWFKVGEACEQSGTTYTAESWDTTYPTKKQCCTKAVWWDADCEDR